MNKIFNKFLLVGDKFIPELFTGPFTKQRERTQKLKKTGNLKHLYRNELDKVSFSHDSTYSDSKDLAKRTISD